MFSAERIVARYIESARFDDNAYRQTPQYQTGPKNPDYYPQVAPPGLSVPSEMNSLSPLLRKLAEGMPDKDYDKNRGGYTNPGFKAAYKVLVEMLMKGSIDEKDLWEQMGQVEKVKSAVVMKGLSTTNDADYEPYRFAGRRLLGLWRVYNELSQSDTLQKIKDKHRKLQEKRKLPYGATPTTRETPRGTPITPATVDSIEVGTRVRCIIGEGDEMFELNGEVKYRGHGEIMVGSPFGSRTVWTYSAHPGPREYPLSRVVLP